MREAASTGYAVLSALAVAAGLLLTVLAVRAGAPSVAVPMGLVTLVLLPATVLRLRRLRRRRR